MWIRRLLLHLASLLLTVLLGGLLGATLVRLAPGFGVDDRELDPRLNRQSVEALRRSRLADRGIISYYGHYLAGLVRGDLGVSQSLGRPVRELFVERAPVTACWVGLGLLGGWSLGLALALPSAATRRVRYDLCTTVVSGFFLCLPSGVLALLFLFFDGPGPLAIALVIFPRIFRYCRNLFEQTYRMPHVLTARAKGLDGTRTFVWHVLPITLPAILALMGISVSMAFGAAIPIEVLCDSPGIGQLAWRAALGRDLPLLVNLTVLVTLITLIANSVSDLTAKAFERQRV